MCLLITSLEHLYTTTSPTTTQGKCVSTRLIKLRAMFVLMFLLNWGLNHIYNNRLTPPTNVPPSSGNCNCRNSNKCPLNKNCLVKGVVYKAEVEDEKGEIKDYIGMTSSTSRHVGRTIKHHSRTRNMQSQQSYRSISGV